MPALCRVVDDEPHLRQRCRQMTGRDLMLEIKLLHPRHGHLVIIHGLDT
jgi:hypothetical protein